MAVTSGGEHAPEHAPTFDTRVEMLRSIPNRFRTLGGERGAHLFWEQRRWSLVICYYHGDTPYTKLFAAQRRHWVHLHCTTNRQQCRDSRNKDQNCRGGYKRTDVG